MDSVIHEDENFLKLLKILRKNEFLIKMIIVKNSVSQLILKSPSICLATDFIWMCNHDVCECGHHTPTPVMDFAPCGPSWTEEIDAWSRLWILSYKSSGKNCKTQRQYHSVKRGVLSNLFLRYPLKKNAWVEENYV